MDLAHFQARPKALKGSEGIHFNNSTIRVLLPYPINPFLPHSTAPIPRYPTRSTTPDSNPYSQPYHFTPCTTQAHHSHPVHHVPSTLTPTPYPTPHPPHSTPPPPHTTPVTPHRTPTTTFQSLPYSTHPHTHQPKPPLHHTTHVPPLLHQTS